MMRDKLGGVDVGFVVFMKFKFFKTKDFYMKKHEIYDEWKWLKRMKNGFVSSDVGMVERKVDAGRTRTMFN